MKAKVRNFILYTLLVLAVTLSVGAGYMIYIYVRSHNQPAMGRLMRPTGSKLEMILGFITANYVDSISPAQLQEQVLPLLFEQLDPHSAYIPASEVKRMQEPMTGSFEGVGITFTMLADTVVVQDVIASGPAQRAGIQVGDRIHTIEQDTVAGRKVPQDSIMARLRGQRGTEVMVGIQRAGNRELIPIRVVRDKIPINSVEVAYMADAQTGVVRLSRFSKTTPQDFQQAFMKLAGQGMQQMVLDLRGNGGGILEVAHFLAGQFLYKGDTIVYTEGRARERYYYLSLADGPLRNVPLVVLIDEFSASSSEIVAGAIQDNDRGYIVGRRSFGKGLVQEQVVLSDGSALRLTTQRYYTPSGRLIQRPYKLGEAEQYEEDIVKRWEHGELLDQDSVIQDTTQRYYTHAGRVVYGGGGIMPDYFVGIDTASYGNYFLQLSRKALQLRFAQHYLDLHRNELQALGSVERLLHHLKGQNLFDQLVSFSHDTGIKPPTAKDRTLAQEVLTTQLYAYIARGVFDNECFYPIMQRYDPVMLKALEVIHNPEAMRNLRQGVQQSPTTAGGDSK